MDVSVSFDPGHQCTYLRTSVRIDINSKLMCNEQTDVVMYKRSSAERLNCATTFQIPQEGFHGTKYNMIVSSMLLARGKDENPAYCTVQN